MEKRFSIIIPVYNEAFSLKELCEGIQKSCADFTGYEVIFVDDASTDNSAEILRQISAVDKNISFYTLPYNTGKAGAIVFGVNKAANEIIITMDGDLQDDPNDIPLFLAKLDEGYDIVCGYRENRKDNYIKKKLSGVYNFALRLLSGSSLKDFNCGFKAFRKTAALHVFSHTKDHRFFAFDACLHKLNISEVKISNHSRKYGKSRFGNVKYIIFLRDFAKYYLRRGL